MAELSRERKAELSRLERGVWSERLTVDGAARFKAWVESAAPKFLDEANHLIGDAELARDKWGTARPRAIGVGIFYYEED
jgi:hypothetical protein